VAKGQKVLFAAIMAYLRWSLHRHATRTGTRLILQRLYSRNCLRKLALCVLALLILGTSAACVYRAPLSQGNLLKQEDLDQVKVGMTRNQVRFLLGTPMIDDPFHTNRWDYIYYLTVGRKKATFKRWVSVYFENEVVSRIVDDQELNPNL
jgi:outer membrane protein assembly factor BamE